MILKYLWTLVKPMVTPVSFGIAPLAILGVQAGLAAGKSIYNFVKARKQRKLARNLKESTFIPRHLNINKELYDQQAHSKRAPGQSMTESNIRRTTSSSFNKALRYAGGDVNKAMAILAGLDVNTKDAMNQAGARGEAFSEGAIDKLAGVNTKIAGEERINKDQYLNTKARLNYAADANDYAGVTNALGAGIGFASGIPTGGAGGGGGNNPVGSVGGPNVSITPQGPNVGGTVSSTYEGMNLPGLGVPKSLYEGGKGFWDPMSQSVQYPNV